MQDLILVGLVFTAVWSIGWWLFSLYAKDASWVDVAWGWGPALLGLLTLTIEKELLGVQVVAVGLVMLWGLRLTTHILLRKKRDQSEDFRYQAMRKKRGKHFWWQSYFTIFLLQALLMSVLVMPLYTLSYADEFNDQGLLVIGGFVWLIGFFFETVGDYQLTKFKSQTKNKGKILQAGLWRYTRHPNYFGEVAMWWGIWIIAMTAVNGWLAVVSPAMMTFFLLKISGLNLIDEHFKNNKEYQAYKKKTSAFLPLPPKD